MDEWNYLDDVPDALHGEEDLPGVGDLRVEQDVRMQRLDDRVPRLAGGGRDDVRVVGVERTLPFGFGSQDGRVGQIENYFSDDVDWFW